MAITRALILFLGALLAIEGRADESPLMERIAQAEPGATLIVPAGRYAGPIRIKKPITLIADGQAIIDGGGEGNIIEIVAPDVTIRGFHIQGTGDSLDRENAAITIEAPRALIEGNVLSDVLFGVYLREAAGSVLRSNIIGGKALPPARRGDGIRLWQSDDCVVEGNLIHNSRDVVMWFSDRTVVRRNRVHDGRYGLHFMYSDDNVLEDNSLEDNSVGAFLMYSAKLTLRRNRFVGNRGPSGYGIGLKDIDGLLAENNLFAANRVGAHLDSSPSIDVRHLFRGNVFAFNDIGVAFMPSVERNDFTNNTFLDNTEQIAILGRGELADDRFTIEGRGNYWSDYPGYDADGDGVGDLPYRAESLFENLLTRKPKLRLFLHSPVQQAIEAAARLAPIVRPSPTMEDQAPLMTPVALPLSVRPPRSGAGSVRMAGFALLAGGACIVMLLLPIDERVSFLRAFRSAPVHKGPHA